MLRPLFALPFAFLLSITPALADDDWVPPVTDELTRKECGQCHTTFQPGFLPARSWDRMMDELAQHFGEDASLAPAKAEAIRNYLTANAGDRVGKGLSRSFMRWVAPEGTPQRITENPAFLREHDFRESVWKRPEVGARSNCPACHVDAERGWFED